MADDGSWLARTGTRLRGVAEYLREHGGTASRADILAWVEKQLPPNEAELKLRSSGKVVWENDVLWQTTGMVKAGWLLKDGAGTWTLTSEGAAVLHTITDGAEYLKEARRLYDLWKKESEFESPKQRAWLIRGSSVLGMSVVPQWLAEGFVSLAASQLSEPRRAVTADELEALAADDYAHLKHQELQAKVAEIVAFVMKVKVGDLVLTTSEQDAYVGEVTGDWTYTASEGKRTNLRREVSWRNADVPVGYADLPSPLPARLKTGATVLDLTDQLALIEGLGSEAALTDSELVAVEPELKHHEHLASPSPGLAGDLFVDPAWLTEVRDLLDERRQVIFYGPPGTGKTWIAQKLAAHLVGPEQVKLVQFHPAYTYEDFFEGYRPAMRSQGGTLAFELRAGPFRQLVNRARQHPDQAFVLIIDEINRANLAKVFGELYFLLEYRDQAVDLLYSSDEEGFTLPTNLYVIGTMNTADRSIALLDSAMRRRFAFVELSPDEEPTRSLLARWSEHHGLGSVGADLLAELNRRIDDPDFRIGPSCFMKHDKPNAFEPERLDRIWRTSILPLLQEHHYGQWDQVAARYRLKSLLAAIAADASEADAADPEGATGVGPPLGEPIAPNPADAPAMAPAPPAAGPDGPAT